MCVWRQNPKANLRRILFRQRKLKSRDFPSLIITTNQFHQTLQTLTVFNFPFFFFLGFTFLLFLHNNGVHTSFHFSFSHHLCFSPPSIAGSLPTSTFLISLYLFTFCYEFSVAEIIYFQCSSFLLCCVFLFSSFVSVNNHKSFRFCCCCCC
jgi:hypothetical protein